MPQRDGKIIGFRDVVFADNDGYTLEGKENERGSVGNGQ